MGDDGAVGERKGGGVCVKGAGVANLPPAANVGSGKWRAGEEGGVEGVQGLPPAVPPLLVPRRPALAVAPLLRPGLSYARCVWGVGNTRS